LIVFIGLIAGINPVSRLVPRVFTGFQIPLMQHLVGLLLILSALATFVGLYILIQPFRLRVTPSSGVNKY